MCTISVFLPCAEGLRLHPGWSVHNSGAGTLIVGHKGCRASPISVFLHFWVLYCLRWLLISDFWEPPVLPTCGHSGGLSDPSPAVQFSTYWNLVLNCPGARDYRFNLICSFPAWALCCFPAEQAGWWQGVLPASAPQSTTLLMWRRWRTQVGRHL